jgi:pimeloyl-ACP methyl ester carboxylesterase
MVERKVLTTASGATISYLEYPSRPPSSNSSDPPKSGLVVLHGGLKSSRSHSELAEALSSNSDVTVYLPDRRGRGLTSPHGLNFTMATEVEDVKSLLLKTGARFVLGVSGGAGVALEAALEFSASLSDGSGGLIQKVAIFEPQLFCDDWDAFQQGRERFDREINEGKKGAALITALKMSEMGPWALRMLPRWVLDPLASWGQAREEAKGQSSGNRDNDKNDGVDSEKAYSI